MFGLVRQAGVDLSLDLKIGDVKSNRVIAVDADAPETLSMQARPLSASFTRLERTGSAGGGDHGTMPRATSLLERLLAWIIITLLLPVFTINMVRGTVRRQSNSANFFALSIYTVVDILLMSLLMLGQLPLGLTIAAVGLSGVGALFYNISVMTWAVRQAGLAAS